MYYKIIDDHEVFSTCRSIQMPGGEWISNPTEEQIAEAGWLPYVPPVVPPAPALEPDTEATLRAVRQMFASQAEELTDEEALEVAAIYPAWADQIGKQVAAGVRLWYDGHLYRVIQPHIPQADWTPDITPALYTEVSVVEWPEIPENIPSTAPWMSGDKGTWKGQHYICQLDNCTWNPDQYPAAWKLQD